MITGGQAEADRGGSGAILPVSDPGFVICWLYD